MPQTLDARSRERSVPDAVRVDRQSQTRLAYITIRDMRWSDINFRPTAKTLRQFAGLWVLFTLAIAAWQGLAHDRTGAATVLIALAVTVAALGVARPTAIRWLFVALTVATFPVGWLMSWLLFGGLYYGVFAPLAFCFRLLGRDALHRRFDAGAESYWTNKAQATDMRRYFRQF